MYYLTKHKEMLGFSSFKNFSNIFNFTTSRNGGVSDGTYGSFNCYPYSGDKLENVELNKAKLLKHLPNKPICVVEPYQTHEAKVYCIDESFILMTKDEQSKHLNGVDAVVTSIPHVLLTIGTADCVPITFYDPIKHVAALAHAGWRGTVSKIALNVLSTMQSSFGCNLDDIQIGIGPSISICAFEIGNEVVLEFKEAGFDIDFIASINPTTNKFHIDLWKANQSLLEQAGVPSLNIEQASICTYASHDEFFSARRLGINSGRITTGIMILE